LQRTLYRQAKGKPHWQTTSVNQAIDIDFDHIDIESALRDPKFCGKLHALEQAGGKVEKVLLGLVHDRDVIVLWGDPHPQAQAHA
jgi:hypothetical protein